MSVFSCPKCNSPDTKSFTAAYQSETTLEALPSVSEKLESIAFRTTGHISNQTLLAKIARPPAKPKLKIMDFILAVGFGAGIFIFFLIIGILTKTPATTPRAFLVTMILTPLLPVAYLVIKYLINQSKKDVWRQQLRIWERSWLCFKCGNAFISK